MTDEAVYTMLESLLEHLDYLPPRRATVYLATYLEMKSFAKPDEVVLEGRVRSTHTIQGPDDEDGEKLPPLVKVKLEGGRDHLVRFVLSVDTHPFPLAEYAGGAVTIPRTWSASGENVARFLLTDPRLADLIYDDLAELNACGFPFAEKVARLSTDVRRELFERNLGEIKQRPQGVPDKDADWFLRVLAEQATYDEEGDYFNKWAAGEPGPNRLHTSEYDGIVDDLRQEIHLKKGRMYCMVVSDLGAVFYRIERDGGRVTRLTPHRLSTAVAPLMGTWEDNVDRHFDVYLIATLQGAKKENEAKTRATYGVSKSQHASFVVVDPKNLIAAALGEEEMKALDIAEDDDDAWFLEMCADVFPQPFYALPTDFMVTRDFAKGYPSLRRAVRKFVEKTYEKIGPVDDKPASAAARRRTLAKVQSRKGPIYMPQGFPTSKTTLFVGSDGYFAFDYDLDNGFIYAMPLAEWLEGLEIQQVAQKIYADTKWLIPMMETVAYIAAAAVGGLTAITMRKFILKRVRKEIGKEIVKEAIDAVKPALVALFVDIYIDLVTVPVLKHLRKLDHALRRVEHPELEDAEAYLGRWQSFLRGFFDGYIHLNLDARVESLANRAIPWEIQAVRLTKRLYSLVGKFRAFLGRVEGELKDGALAQGLQNIETAAVHVTRGMAFAMALLYYVDPEDAAPFLELFNKDGKPPDPDVWEKEVRSAVSSIGGHVYSAADGVRDLNDALDLSSAAPYAIGAAITTGYLSFAMVALQAGIGDGKTMLLLGGLAVGALVATGTLDEAYGVGKELLGDLVWNNFPGRDPHTAHINGRLLGTLVGTFLVDRKLFGEGSKMGKWVRSSKPKRILIEGALAGSLVKNVLMMLLRRYLIVADKLIDKGGRAARVVRTELRRTLEDQRALRAERLEEEGRGHLEAFWSQDNDRLNVRELIQLLLRLVRLLRQDMAELAASYDDDVEAFRDDFKAAEQLARAAGLDEVAKKHGRALMIQMNALAYRACLEVLRAWDALFEPFTAGDLSWMTFLRELGVDSGDIGDVHDEVREALAPHMEAFRAKAERLEDEAHP